VAAGQQRLRRPPARGAEASSSSSSRMPAVAADSHPPLFLSSSLALFRFIPPFLPLSLFTMQLPVGVRTDSEMTSTRSI